MKPVARSESMQMSVKRGVVGGLVAVAALMATTLTASRAEAHAIGLSSGEYAASGSSLRGKLVFARGEVAGLLPALDANGDGHVTAAEVESARGALEAKVVRRVLVTAGGEACPGMLTDAALTEQDGLMLSGKWDCSRAGPFDVDLAVFDDLSHGHRHLARTTNAGKTVHDDILFRGQQKFSVPSPSDGTTEAAPAAPKPEATTSASAWTFFKMGVEHILKGYDHLVFLLGLVLLRARVRSLLSVVTAFTLAHSITLAIAVLGVWTPSSRIIEPAVALSIAYVGIENFFVKDASKRWRITFPFGLIHGFAFAGALQELGMAREAVPGVGLVTFNLGVEAGQLGVMALVLPLIALLRDRRWFELRGVKVVSGAVALAGGILFVTRVLEG